MKILIAVLLILFSQTQVHAQKKIRTLTLSDSILNIAIDRPGDFYAITRQGQIQRFDKDGKLTLLYKAPQPPTLFDPRDGARLFAYYRHDQHYEFLTPSFEVSSSFKIDPAFAIQPWLMCPSGEYKLWILDKADHSLKKINVKASEVELEVVVDSALIRNAEAFTVMRDYQGFVFLLNPSQGILIFNSLGHHIRSLDAPGIHAFNFLGEELYYLIGDTIRFFNLFTADKREIKINPGYKDALLTDERLILATPEKIDIYSFRP